MKRALATLLIIFVLSPLSVFAQQFTISGKIVNKDDKEPISYADVYIAGTQNYTNSDNKGNFTLKLSKGKHTVSVGMLGYVTKEINFEVKETVTNVVVELTKSTLNIDGIVVTASTSQSKEGTSTYSIGTEAIKQIQAVSLSDVMSLLPGGKLSPLDLDSSLQTNIRSAESSSVNSFGTAIIVDGAPMSNDGNMQVTNASSGLSSGSNVAGKGTDLREIPASNIESVEVVTGVASAKYGNITSGAVIVTRKAGYSPLTISFNSTTNTYQGSISQGLQLKNGDYLNIDGDYAYSNGSETEIKNYYQRVGVSSRWTSSFSKALNWNNTMSFSYSFSGDGQREEPDETLASITDIQNHYLSFGINGSLGILGKLNYTFNGSYADQYTSIDKEVTDGNVPLIEPTETGTYITNQFTSLIYRQETEMIGRPINLYGRIEADQSIDWMNNNFSFNTGVEYTLDKNYGEGRIVGEGGVSASGTPGTRGMIYNNIPASKNFSAYHQTNISRNFDVFMYNLRLGLRYDNMLERYNRLSPRLSGSVGLFDKFKINAAWGLSYKAPSMVTLYPGPTYFDITNFSDYNTYEVDRVAVVTTYVFDDDNTYLEPSRGETKELSFEWADHGYSLRLTGFNKIIDGGITTQTTLAILENQGYDLVWGENGEKLYDDNGVRLVEADPNDVTYVARTYSRYSNTYRSESNGLELTFSPPYIESTHTGFNLSGQFITTNSWNTIPEVKASNGSTTGVRYGVYNDYKYKVTNASANATIIQQIPDLRLMITLTTELNLYYKSEYIQPDRYPLAYYDSDGTYIEIPESDKMNDEYSDLVLSESSAYPTIVPFYPNFHINIRKETKSGHSFSFYANNCFWYNPYCTDQYSENTSRLNSTISFGFGLTLKL